jgi:hypothetical protein
MNAAKPAHLDPIYVIFEQHLVNFQDSEMNRQAFIEKVVHEYFTYLRKMNITIPKSLEQPIYDELSDQVQGMLIKKIYGFLTLQDYQRSVPSDARRRARARYSRLAKK